MFGGRFGLVWARGIFGFGLLSALATACGSGDGHKQERACPEDCPAEQCDLATGECLAATEPSDGGAADEPAPGAGAGAGGASAGAPSEVDDTAPRVTITSPKPGGVESPSVTFDFEADEPSMYTCTLNDEPVKKCKPGITLDDLDSGENTFSVIATDAAGNESKAVEVTFIVDRPPTIGDLDAIVTPEDVSTGELPFTIDDPDSDVTDLVVTATLDSAQPIRDSGLILGGSGLERSVKLTPAPNEFGPAVLTLSVTDGFATTTKDVQVTVTPVNDPPTIEDVADKRVAEHAVLGPVVFHVSDLETPAKDLVVTAKSSDTVKVPNQNIVLGGTDDERSFTITPVAQQSGPVTITLTVSDGELTATDSFVLTLGSTDDEPTIAAIADQTTPEDTPKTVAFTVGDPDTALNNLKPSASFDVNGIIKSVTFGGSGANRTLTVTPKQDQTGNALISVTISDASGGVSTSFVLTVTPVNDAPTITAPANQIINEDTSTGALPFAVADVDSATVSVTATSSNTTLIPNANITVAPVSGSPGSRNVTLTPVANGNGGPVSITLTASDGTLTGTKTFTVTVTPVNDPPTISDIANKTLEPNTSTGALAFTVADIDGDTPLTVSAKSSDTRVVPAAGIALGGAGANRTITVVPGANQGGSSIITVTVNDGHGGTASDTFTVSAKVTLTGTVVGSGTVLASGTGCPGGTAICTALPGPGTVTFVATPGAGATFVNWTGACSGSGNGVVTPIPTAGATCTANFKNLWARLFYGLNSDQQPLATITSTGTFFMRGGVIETPKALHYLAGELVGETDSTAIMWNADPVSGAVLANSAIELTERGDGTPMTPAELLRDPSNGDGTVMLSNVTIVHGSGLMWFDDANKVTRGLSYQTGDGLTDLVPYAAVRSKDGGITFTETSHGIVVGANTPTLGQLTRVDATGAVLGATSFQEGLGQNCLQPGLAPEYFPIALGVNSAGNYLIAGAVQPIDGAGPRLNLTLFDSAGIPQWGYHVEAEDRGTTIVAEGVLATGTSFFVSGQMSNANGAASGFGMLVTSTGEIKWWKSFDNVGAEARGFKAALQGNDFVLTGLAMQQGAADLFALRWKGDGSVASGFVYGSGGTDEGVYISPAANGGYNLFGNSAGSFGNAPASSWALRVDKNLQIKLQTGAVSAYAPTLADQATTHVDATCVTPLTYTELTPTAHTLNTFSRPFTIDGAYQATP
jgi:hypothetical protein